VLEPPNLPIIQSPDFSIPQQASIWVDMREGFRYLWGMVGGMALIGRALIFKVALTPAFKLYSPGPI
jgi:hypothetical protein